MFLTEIRMVVWKTSEIIIQTKDTITFLWEDINLFIWEEIETFETKSDLFV